MSDAATCNVEVQLAAAKQHLRCGQFDAAESIARESLNDYPDHRDALYVFAVSLRYQGKHKEALVTLARLTALAPSLGRTHQETGYNYRALGRNIDTIAEFEKAVALDPALMATWQALMNFYKAKDLQQDFQRTAAHYNRLLALPKNVRTVASLINEGKYYKAEQVCRQFLIREPKNVEAMRLLADIGVRLHVYDDAEFLLESVLEFQPDYHLARMEYASVLRKRQKYDKALGQANILKKLDPTNIAYQSLYANIKSAIGDHSEAIKVFQSMLTRAPDSHELHASCGHALKTVGRVDEAVDSYRRAYRAKADYGDAYWSLANLKIYEFSNQELRQARYSEAANTTSAIDRIHLCFALGKAYEDRKEFDSAFEYYDRGNRLRREQSKYTIGGNDEEMQLQIDVCNQGLFDKTAGQGCSAKDPIFIVGLPRSGSTLLEQILASHSEIEGTRELPNIIALSHKLDGRRKITDEHQYPAVLTKLDAKQLRILGESYIADSRVHRSGAPYFTDKMPNNFRHIGLIHMILPNAKIIDARRHPMACCFSGFKQLFAVGQEFSYGQKEIGSYYKKYVLLMDHWEQVLPGKILRVQYEDVVADLEGQARRILDHCDLPFEESCIAFYKSGRSVRTPSAEQVRQPIYQSGLDQWRNFEHFLGPLTDALGPILDRYPIPQLAANQSR